jgi:hypothetical protein
MFKLVRENKYLFHVYYKSKEITFWEKLLKLSPLMEGFFNVLELLFEPQSHLIFGLNEQLVASLAHNLVLSLEMRILGWQRFQQKSNFQDLKYTALKYISMENRKTI